MKFRDKQTGKIRNFEFVVITKDMDAEFAKYAHNAPVLICRSIDQLNADWEDYKPTEPLIKDEKIRKAVRAWAEALGQREQFLCIKNGTRLEISDGSPHLLYISFWADKLTLDSIDDRTYYTIAELCGEEE